MTPTPDDDELRRRVSAAYDDVLREPVPDRLKQLLEKPAPVVDLAAERARRRGSAASESKWTWAHWGGMAASLAVGVIAGALFMPRSGSEGVVVAGSTLTRALDTQLAGDASSTVAVQLSFLDRDGRYCRTFGTASTAGLACREGTQWNVVATAPASAANGRGMRQAATPLPKPVLDAVDAKIAGNALDAAQERAARDRGWRR